MQDLLLLAATAAMFAFGWFLMKRLDWFLDSNHQAQELWPEADKDAFRVYFSEPSDTDSITDVLKRFLTQSV